MEKHDDDEKKTNEKEREKKPEPNKIQERKGMEEGGKGKRGDGILETTTDHVGGLYQRAAPLLYC